jgi:hypothetical protein
MQRVTGDMPSAAQAFSLSASQMICFHKITDISVELDQCHELLSLEDYMKINCVIEHVMNMYGGVDA